MQTETPSGIAKEFLIVVQNHWPEFLQSAHIDECGSLIIECLSPSGKTGLWISADMDFDEIIIGMGGGHSHGGAWDDPTSGDYLFKSSIDFINGILTEKIVGCTLRNGGGAIGELVSLREQAYWKNVSQVVSWRGTFDQLITSDSP